MGWFRRNDKEGVTADEVVALRARIDELEALVVSAQESQPEPDEPGPPSTPLPAPPLGATSYDRSQLAHVVDRLDALDARVTSIAQELTNQLDELASEIDATDTNDANEFGTRLDTAVAAIRQTTEALAAEQARYEMQFRADLAEIADRATRGR
ncbi:MAG: hypothetical protein AAGF73_02800 [Actinomycetota bacterium]